MDISAILLVTAVAGAVEFLRRVKVSDWFAAVTIAVSAVIGMVMGAMDAPGVPDVWTGLVLGLGASGFVTIASRVNTSASVTQPVVKRKVV